TIRLGDERDTPAQFLSHGQRQWLEIGLLLANEVELLLLDEPTAGMTAEETAATGQLVQHLAADRALSVIIIEHDINFVRELKAPITVLHLARVLREGSFDQIADDEQIRQVYLGTAHA
ncbi:MAG: ATP-binding cassette domain-containing protein, partial [Dongiaceae bacterium]